MATPRPARLEAKPRPCTSPTPPAIQGRASRGRPRTATTAAATIDSAIAGSTIPAGTETTSNQARARLTAWPRVKAVTSAATRRVLARVGAARTTAKVSTTRKSRWSAPERMWSTPRAKNEESVAGASREKVTVPASASRPATTPSALVSGTSSEGEVNDHPSPSRETSPSWGSETKATSTHGDPLSVAPGRTGALRRRRRASSPSTRSRTWSRTVATRVAATALCWARSSSASMRPSPEVSCQAQLGEGHRRRAQDPLVVQS